MKTIVFDRKVKAYEDGDTLIRAGHFLENTG
jgi:hypothetical protein